MLRIWKEHPDVCLDCVVPRAARFNSELTRLAMDDRVRWHTGISAEELRKLYQQASLLFLPLIDATANNALLEALACGLPVISTEVGGTHEYLPLGAGALCRQGDSEDHAEKVIVWLGDQIRRQEAGKIAREWVVRHCDWSRIAEKLNELISHSERI